MSTSDPIRGIDRSLPLARPVEPVVRTRVAPRERDARQDRGKRRPPPAPPRVDPDDDAPLVDVRA